MNGDDTPPMGIERPELREVIGVGGETIVLGPADVLIIRIYDEVHEEMMLTLDRILGRNTNGDARFVVFHGNVDLVVARDVEQRQ